MPISMVTRLYADTRLDMLQFLPKRVIHPGARWLDKPGHRSDKQRNFEARGGDDEEEHFRIYQRQSLRKKHDFSCGILYVPHGGQSMTLARYDGSSHRHGGIAYRPHLHLAITADNENFDLEATATDRFECLWGAFACLIGDFNVTGFKRDDQPTLLWWC